MPFFANLRSGHFGVRQWYPRWGVITTLLERVLRLVIDITIKEQKYKATGDKHWFDQLSPPEIPAHLQPFVKAS